jgi:hypothetical protein
MCELRSLIRSVFFDVICAHSLQSHHFYLYMPPPHPATYAFRPPFSASPTECCMKKRRTEAQDICSRANGAKSTGPRHPARQLMSSKNSLKHGLLATAVLLLPGESRKKFLNLCTELTTEYGPASPTEWILFGAHHPRPVAPHPALQL